MSLRDIFKVHKRYFTEFNKEISHRNLKLMATVCYFVITIFSLYYLVTFLFFRDRMMPLGYGLIVPVAIVFLLLIQACLKSFDTRYRQAQRMALYMYIVLMFYCVVTSVFPHPELNAVYYPLFLIAGPVMFILPIYQQVAVGLVSYAAFFLFVVQTKPEAMWAHDLFETFTALLFSFAVILLMTQFRVQSDTLKSKYYSLSRNDGLTGILNKTAGSEMMRSYIEYEYGREPFALVILDIDDFKNVNDTYGHECGDRVLKAFGQTIADFFRKDDIVSRFGGDEFVILMRNISRENCEGKLTQFEQFLSTLRMVQDVQITVSMGVYVGVCSVDTYETALRNADKALYSIKQHGKRTHSFYQ